MKHITMFDKAYSIDKITEGQAVAQALRNGDCNRCEYYLKCSLNTDFEFPENAACMQRKRRIERNLHNGNS